MDIFGRIKKIALFSEVSLQLGLYEVWLYALHRLKIFSGYYRLILPIQKLKADKLFIGGTPNKISGSPSASLTNEVEKILNGEFLLFSHHYIQCEKFPDWHYDYFNEAKTSAEKHCLSTIFGRNVDPKCIWELSRFEWATKLARAWNLTRDVRYLERLDLLALDWLNKNPPYQGANWYCGQECSIRLINLLLCNKIIGQNGRVNAFNSLIKLHFRRIQSTTSYGRSQNNNHGITEAAALYIGGIWLSENCADFRDYSRFIAESRSMLIERVSKLILPDGGFSQYSVNYHRLLLDTLVQVEAWRSKLELEPFPKHYYNRVRTALDWLKNVSEPKYGLAPNLGANDGARLFHLSDEPYEDFRPTIRLGQYYFGAGVKFNNHSKDFAWDLEISGINYEIHDKVSRVYPNFGLAILRNDTFSVYIRFANFDYRPSQADCLHVDLFSDGINLLCDLGSYSYHNEEHFNFSGAKCHNTIIFDDHDQMPRLGQFLFGQWLKMEEVGNIEFENLTQSWAGQYSDRNGNSHRRQVIIEQGNMKVFDRINGPFTSCTINWHLNDSNWEQTECGARSRDFEISIQTSGSAAMALEESSLSRMYQHKKSIPVLRVKFSSECQDIVTTIKKIN